MMTSKRYLTVLLLIPFASMFHSYYAFAVGSAGFENASYSARSLGKANAVVADPEEASTIAFNPAGMTELDGIQVNTSTTMIIPMAEYNGANGGADEEAAEPFLVVPATFLSLSTPVENLKIGLGANSPFGLLTQYSSTGTFKYSSYYNEIKTSDYYLSAAYKIAPWISIGGGLNYMESNLKQVGKLNSNFLTSTVIPGTIGLADAPFELDVDGFGYGWNLGVFIKPDDFNQFGIFYRSSIKVKYEGNLSVDNIQGLVLPTVFGGGSFNTSADTDITFPDNLTFGYQRKISDKLDLEVDLGWTNWSEFDRIDIAFGTSNSVLNGLEPVNEHFNDTISVHCGGSYNLSPTWTLMGGYFYFERAASKADYSNAIPDGDRHALSTGLQYNNKWLSVDLTYLGEIISSTTIDNNVGAGNGTTVDGEYSSYIHLVSISTTLRF